MDSSGPASLTVQHPQSDDCWCTHYIRLTKTGILVCEDEAELLKASDSKTSLSEIILQYHVLASHLRISVQDHLDIKELCVLCHNSIAKRCRVCSNKFCAQRTCRECFEKWGDREKPRACPYCTNATLRENSNLNTLLCDRHLSRAGILRVQHELELQDQKSQEVEDLLIKLHTYNLVMVAVGICKPLCVMCHRTIESSHHVRRCPKCRQRTCIACHQHWNPANCHPGYGKLKEHTCPYCTHYDAAS